MERTRREYVKGVVVMVIVFAITMAESYTRHSDAREIEDPWWTPVVDNSTIRLVNGSDKFSGRVEVKLHEKWGTICDDFFDVNDATVVCRMLNMYNETSLVSAYGKAQFGAGAGVIHYDNLRCNGTEQNISDCSYSHSLYTNCGHIEDAGVNCKAPELRLVNGTLPHQGLVQMYRNGKWGTICADGIGTNEAKVLCRSIGFPEGKSQFQSQFSDDHVSMSNLTCSGNEDDVTPCLGWKIAVSCDSNQSVWLECPKKIRLLNGANRFSGYIDVYEQKQWGTICDTLFDKVDAMVACRMLDMDYGESQVVPYTHSYYGHGSSRRIFDDLNCTGNEIDIATCPSKSLFDWSCSFTRVAGVDCRANPVRLVNGSSPNEGVLEVFVNATWGSVCGDDFGRAEALVVCGTLGYHTGNVTTDIIFVDDVPALSNVSCNGNETDIMFCSADGWNNDAYCESNNRTWIHCENNNIRLVNGPDEFSGLVEMYSNGRWGPICDDDFDQHDADVVCRMLDVYYGDSVVAPRGNAFYGYGDRRPVIENLICNGHETDIANCLSKPITSFCSVRKNAGVDCRGNAVRLINGPTSKEGLVTVYVNGTRGTVCATNFGMEEAKVVCRRIGYPTGKFTIQSRYDTHHLALSDVNCQGNETDLISCTGDGWDNTPSCASNNKIWLKCENTNIRLVNGTDAFSGRVEVFFQGHWGTMCDDDFDKHEARVVCRMLGYPDEEGDVEAYRYAHFGQGSGPIIIDDTECYGTELDIAACGSTKWLTSDCDHSEDAGVKCGAGIRLVDGRDKYSGRVEVLYRGQWGTVCDDSFDERDALVICRMLGFLINDHDVAAYANAYYGQGNGSIIIDDLACHGHEALLTDCSSRPWLSHNCSHSNDAGVDCRATTAATKTPAPHVLIPSIHPAPTVSTTHSSVNISLNDAVHVSCDDFGWDVRVTMTTLRQLYPHAISSDIYLGDNSCTGVESSGVLQFKQSFRQCLTSERTQGSRLVYTNQLVYAQHDPANPFVIRSFNWTIPVECDVERNETSLGHLQHVSHSSTTGPTVVAKGHYVVNMSFFQDPNFLQEIKGNPLKVVVGQPVFVKAFTRTADWTIKMRVHTCYTKPTQHAPDSKKLYIIRNGCELDTNTHILSQSSHETRFVFQDFAYTTDTTGIYLYCDATFCDNTDYYSRSCLQTCQP